jgi:hypothetical protein
MSKTDLHQPETALRENQDQEDDEGVVISSSKHDINTDDQRPESCVPGFVKDLKYKYGSFDY